MSSTMGGTSDDDAANALAGARRRGARLSATFGVMLVVSVGLNVWGMVHYRLPGPLWRAIQKSRESLPVITLRPGPDAPPARPALGFTSAINTDVALRDWQTRGRHKLAELMGVSLPREAPAARLAAEASLGNSLVRETIVFTMADGVEVPGFLLRPTAAGRRAGLMVIPGHSRGIVATAGLIEDYQHGNALALARAGYVVLTIEVRGFGYSSTLGPPPALMDRQAFVGYCLVNGTTALGVTVSDASAGLNYLAARTEVDRDRLGVVGFSSGGKAAILLAAVDSRVTAIVGSGCVSSHEYNFAYCLHDPYEALPGLARWLGMSDCLGLLAPRPLLVHWGQKDDERAARSASYNESSLREYDAAAVIYRAAGRADRLEKFVTSDVGHEFDNEAAIRFLTRVLPCIGV